MKKTSRAWLLIVPSVLGLLCAGCDKLEPPARCIARGDLGVERGEYVGACGAYAFAIPQLERLLKGGELSADEGKRAEELLALARRRMADAFDRALAQAETLLEEGRYYEAAFQAQRLVAHARTAGDEARLARGRELVEHPAVRISLELFDEKRRPDAKKYAKAAADAFAENQYAVAARFYELAVDPRQTRDLLEGPYDEDKLYYLLKAGACHELAGQTQRARDIYRAIIDACPRAQEGAQGGFLGTTTDQYHHRVALLVNEAWTRLVQAERALGQQAPAQATGQPAEAPCGGGNDAPLEVLEGGIDAGGDENPPDFDELSASRAE